jgi:predicted amidohydrolase
MKVAAVQMDISILEKDRNLAAVLERLGVAAQAGAKIVVFPECALTGYCFASREEAWPLAETVPGPSTERIAHAARRLGVTAVVGLLERAGDQLFNAAAVVSPEAIHGSYRKIHLPCLGIDWHNTPGDFGFEVFATPPAKIGVNICFDCSFPESGRVLKLRGAQMLAIPTNWPEGSDTWQHTPEVRATENHFHVVAANRVGEERGFRFAGHSKIVDFTGKLLAEGGASEETILYAELDIAAADANRVIRVPGQWEFDRIAARRPETYGAITEAHEPAAAARPAKAAQPARRSS